MIPAGQSKRIVRFAAVGLSVMVIGIVIMVVLVDLFHVNKNVAYLFQSFITVEMNFFLNSFITWPGGTKNRLWKSWLRFHGFKVFTLVSSQVLFAAFLLGIQWLNLGAISVVKRLDYILAFLGCTAVITVINFLGNDHWVFSPAGSSGAD
ncbi:MAG: GtrA family protein [Desulfobacterales bacterium]